jgi:ferredoxin-NADP reductase
MPASLRAYLRPAQLLFILLYVLGLIVLGYIFFAARGGLAVFAGADYKISSLILFPLLGLYAYYLLWVQIIIGSQMWRLRSHIPWIEKFHRTQGVFVLLFALLHPLLILSGFGLHEYLNFKFVAPAGIPYVILGDIQLVLLVCTVVTAILRNTKWLSNHWRKIHYLNYIVFILVWIHSWNLGSDVQGSHLRFVWWVIGVTGLIVIGLRLKELFWPGRAYLVDRQEIADGTMQFWFDTRGRNLGFRAGQYVDLTLIQPPYTDAEGNRRSFSIVTSPADQQRFAIATRMRPTAFKNSLKEIPLGTPVSVVGPMGAFTLHQDTERPAVFLAGGIGVTPMRSMILRATEQKIPQDVYLFYSNRNKASTAFLSDFEKAVSENSRFKFFPTITDAAEPGWQYAVGRIDAAMIRKNLQAVQQAIYYISGPPPMVSAMRQVLEDLNVDSGNIKTEEFSGY